MSYNDEQRGYDQGRADAAGMIGAVHNASIAQNLHHRFVANRLTAQIDMVNAVNQELQRRLQASEECVRFLDQANADLCAQLRDLSSKLQVCVDCSETSQITITYQKAEIARLTAALKKAQFNIAELMIDDPF
jgi:predicted component of type VI protein secretion system